METESLWHFASERFVILRAEFTLGKYMAIQVVFYRLLERNSSMWIYHEAEMKASLSKF